MKKILCALLCLCLMLACAPALGEGRHLNLWMQIESGERHYAQSAQTIGDTVYLLADDGLYRFGLGDAEPVRIEGTEGKLNAYDSPEAAEASITANRLFAKDGCLYGIDTYAGTVTKLLDAEGNVALAPFGTLNLTELNDEVYIENAFFAGETLYMLNSYNRPTMLTFSLEDGAKPETLALENVTATCAYKDGLLLGVTSPTYEEEKLTPTQIVTYDRQSGEQTLLYQTDLESYCSNVAYDHASDRVYLWMGNLIYAYDPADGSLYPCAYPPENGNGIVCMADGSLLLQGYSGLYLRTPAQPGETGGILTVWGEYGSWQHLNVINANPQWDVRLNEQAGADLQALTTAMVSGDDTVDVLKLSLDREPVGKLIDKGYAADLTQFPALAAIAAEMDPALLAPFTRDGKLYALPVGLQISALRVNMTVWTETLGLSPDELPATYGELLDFISNFSYDYGAEHEDVSVTDSWDLRMDLLSAMLLNEMTAQEKAGNGAFDLDTPAFRALLAQLDAIDFSDISLHELLGENATYDDYNEFYSKAMLFTVDSRLSGLSSLENEDARYVLLSLEDSQEPVAPVKMEALLLNPRSAHLDQGAEYIAQYAKHLDATAEDVSLFPGRNEGVVNTNYEQNLKEAEKWLHDREAALEKAAPENRAAIADDLKWAKEHVEFCRDRHYLLGAETIAAFRRDFAPYLYPVLSSAFSQRYSEGEGERSIQTLMEQYGQKAVTADAFLKELSNRLKLMQLENQ